MKKTSKKPSQIKNVRGKKPMASLLKTIKKTLPQKLVQAMSPKMAPKSAAKKPLTKKPAVTAKVAKPVVYPKTAPVKPVAAKPVPVKASKSDKKGASKAAPAVQSESLKKSVKGAKTSADDVVALVPGKTVKGAKPAKLAKDKPKEKSAAAIRAAEAAGEKLCREAGCENIATTKGYCRLDYIKNWKKIKRKEMILKEGKLNQYIEELVSKYPEKYIDVIRQDLSTEVSFTKIIHDLELDESIDDLDYDGDSIDSLIGAISKSSDDFDDGEF